MSGATTIDAADQAETPTPTPTRKVDPGFARNMKIIGGVVAAAIFIVVALIFSMMGKSSNASGPVSVGTTGGLSAAPVKTNNEATPAMQDMLAQRQLEEAQAAKEAGKTYVPKESIGNVIPVSTPAVAEPVVQSGPGQSTMQGANAPYTGPTETDRARLEGMQRQLAVLAAERTPVQPRQSLSLENGSGSSAVASSSATGVGAASAGPTQTLSQNQNKTRTLIQALEIYPAQMSNPINVAQGKSIFASARINGGPFNGAYLTGLATFTDEEVVETTFNSMRHGNKFYRIDAIVLDEQTAAAGIRGEVDRRLLQRYAIPITLAITQGYFAAKAQTGSTVVVGAGGVTAQTVPPPTEQQATDAGIAAGLKIAQGDVDRNAAKPIRGLTQSGAMVGILFRSPVVEEVQQ